MPDNKPSALPHSMILLMATGTGFSVASLYYAQPILSLLARDLHASDRAVGLIPTMTQLGYALGILLLSPLGDRVDRRQIILAKSVLLALSLAICALAHSIGCMMAASMLIGISATLAQDIVPAAAHLAPHHSRGKAVGMVMTGLLLGILLSRVISGVVAEQFGWRVVYLCAALSIVLFAILAARNLPRFAATTRLPYSALLASMHGLWREHPALRQASCAQAMLSVGFSAFWTTLALMLHHTFHLESTVAGAFGLAGAAGSIAAPFAGRMADRSNPAMVARIGCAIATLSFAAMSFAGFFPQHAQLVLLAFVAVGFDFGVQSALVAHQSIVFGIVPEARSRANALLVTCMFLGMATGSVLGSMMFARWGWMGVVALSTAASAAALAVRLHAGTASTAPVPEAIVGNARGVQQHHTTSLV